ncbi:MAG: mandelate racemase/muconate lactonizing enzyme family protein [Candidatus Poribacteria bacterium]|nr:mandelate racemase/muconate lactonizing enzyme family protein [Candidatus Poribacteria bacterium]
MHTLKIKSVETEIIHVNHRGNWLFVKLHAKDGTTGIGEVSHGRDDERVKHLIDALKPDIVGVNVFELEAFRRRFFRESEGHTYHTAFSGIEQAMWDLAGKALGVPSYQLLGGKCRNRIRLYANINRATVDRNPLGFARNAEQAVAEGFTAIKCAPFDGVAVLDVSKGTLTSAIQLGIDRIRAIRAAIGPEIDLMVDCHSRFNSGLIIQTAKMLDDLNLFWIEDPVPLTDLDAVAHVSQSTSIPIATGERLRTLTDFDRLLKRGRVDYILPDVKHVGGLLGLKKIAILAETTNVKVTPHNPSGPVATAASVQCMASVPNFGILEYAWGEVDWRSTLVDPPEQIIDGFIKLSTRSGLGISLKSL